MAATLLHHDLGVTWYETDGMARAAHAIRANDQLWLIDPFDDPAALAAISELGAPAGVIQLLDRHNRDCATIAGLLGIPHHKVPSALPDPTIEVISVVDRPWWHEVALWLPATQTLVIAEAIGTIPMFALDRRAGVHPMLRLFPPRSAFGTYMPERLLVGHGRPLEDGAAEALAAALADSVSDVPRLIGKLPGLLRGGGGARPADEPT